MKNGVTKILKYLSQDLGNLLDLSYSDSRKRSASKNREQKLESSAEFSLSSYIFGAKLGNGLSS